MGRGIAMSAKVSMLSRQWIPMAGGSCDVRMGNDAIEQSGSILAGSVGRPRACMVVTNTMADTTQTEVLRRQLVDAGFAVHWHTPVCERVRTFDAASELAASLASHDLTGDDLCCVLGDADLISMVSYVCGSWCDGMTLIAIPTDELALLEGALVPRALDVAGKPRMVSVRACVRHVLVDYGVMLSEPSSEVAQHLRALMVSAAMAASEREFSALWDRAELIMADDIEALTTQLMATAKARGQIASSTAAATRQSLAYGQTFARALGALLRDSESCPPASVLLAEGMRFSARISVMLNKLSLDDMLAQDELLDALGIGSVTCDVSAEMLIEALRHERFLRTNRFMLLVPMAIGRVRLTTVEDSLLTEHVQAWCAAHAAGRRA